MALGLRGLRCRGLWLLLVTHLCLATACQHTDHGTLLWEFCLPQFQAHMEAVGRTLWCDWGKTIGRMALVHLAQQLLVVWDVLFSQGAGLVKMGAGTGLCHSGATRNSPTAPGTWCKHWTASGQTQRWTSSSSPSTSASSETALSQAGPCRTHPAASSAPSSWSPSW
ncbi:hypothetical protein CapIbe_002000 [Capra ibex]